MSQVILAQGAGAQTGVEGVPILCVPTGHTKFWAMADALNRKKAAKKDILKIMEGLRKCK